MLKEIMISDMNGVRIGHAQNREAKTGVTVLIFDQGARAGIDISGGGPASRETTLASPMTADNPIHAIVLSGGSVFGLAAGDGVVRYLEEHGVGYDTGFAKVPLVCQSCIYDLNIGSATVRPDADMGYAACVDAEKNQSRSGETGAGTGASVGKILGADRATKTGLGIYAVSVGKLQMAAVVVLNALGDIFNPETGKQIAGLRTEDGRGFANSREELYKLTKRTDLFNGNTTIGAIITNGSFTKAELSKIASMTRSAYSRCINPVGTMADGDSIYAASVGNIPADINMAGTLAADVMEKAILKAALPKHFGTNIMEHLK
jgi:L-aminopeptidase/D-esterase-like protein